MLGGVSPRTAARSAKGRRCLVAWLKHLENRSQNAPDQDGSMATHDFEELTELARRVDFGINDFTENALAKLRATMTVASTDDLVRLQAVVPKVVESAKSVRDALEQSEQVDVCDDYPLGVTVTIVGTLVPAVSNLTTVGTRLLVA